MCTFNAILCNYLFYVMLDVDLEQAPNSSLPAGVLCLEPTMCTYIEICGHKKQGSDQVWREG
jgi:hypothetical protein